MELICFKDNQECLDALIKLKVISKTSNLDKLEELKYKQILDGEVVEFKCKILGCASKHTNPNCHDSVYQNLCILADNLTFNINIDYFTTMQKKWFGSPNKFTY